MKDRVAMTLAFIGFIIIAVVVINNYDTTQDEKDFAVGTYYTPSNVKSKTDSSVELYQQMTGSRKLTCPQTEMSKTTNSTFTLATLYGNNNTNKYNAKTLFVTSTFAGATSTNLTMDNSDSDNPIFNLANVGLSTSGIAKANNMSTETEGVKLGELWDFGEYNYIEIIAPFNFVFGSVNTTNSDEIIIVNTKGNCRITFSNVANWFCAGPVGTSQVTSNGTSDVTTSWENHKDSHHTIIGSTTNASVTGGSTKDIIGYATSETTVLIESYSNDGWSPLSLYNFIVDNDKK
jgi:hypothetical protein